MTTLTDKAAAVLQIAEELLEERREMWDKNCHMASLEVVRKADEFGIFSRFHKTYGEQAGKIAKHAFEVADGYWANAPISVNRFTKGSDPYFAEPILARLVQTPTQAW